MHSRRETDRGHPLVENIAQWNLVGCYDLVHETHAVWFVFLEGRLYYAVVMYYIQLTC